MATKVEYTYGLTQRLSHANTWLYYENGTEVTCTRTPLVSLSFLAVKKHTMCCFLSVTS